jgi:hypothetical protein
MTTPKKDRALYPRSYHVDVVQGSRPIKFQTYVLPEYFSFTIYFYDNDGKKVTKENAKNFKTWPVELLIRVTKDETLEVINTIIKGATTYKGHEVMTTKEPKDDFPKFQPVKATYYKSLADNRALLMGYAVTSAVQSFVYKKGKDGSHNWPLFSRVDVSEQELQVLAKGTIKKSYLRKDFAFYQEVARIYKEAVELGEHPNNYLMQRYGKEKTTVQGWTKVCREKGLLGKAEKGKVSTVRKTARKGRAK